MQLETRSKAAEDYAQDKWMIDGAGLNKTVPENTPHIYPLLNADLESLDKLSEQQLA